MSNGDPGSARGVHVGAGSDPRTLGLMAFALGTLAVGIATVGEFRPPTTIFGAVVPIAFLAAGVALVLASFWAFILGSSYWAGTFGIVAGFFFSFSVFMFGLIHHWFAVTLVNVRAVEAIFYIVWCCFFLALITPSLRQPIIYALVAAFLAAYLALAATSTYTSPVSTLVFVRPGGNIMKAAGSCMLAASFLLFWGYVASSLDVLRAKASLPQGPVLLKGAVDAGPRW